MPSNPKGRVEAIDGLRGVAALLVVLYHLHEAIERTASDWLWMPLDWVARNGFLGVDVFFVISGYVIALSVSKGAPTPSYFARFILRRSIRLDPPYWSAILLELALLGLTVRFFSSHPVDYPSGKQLFSHLFYAQELLGYGSLIPIFWTLCYEVQFYGFYVGLVVLQALLPERLQRPTVATVFCAILFVTSLLTRYWPPAGLPNGLAIDRWFQFFIGVLTWRATTGRGRLGTLVASWFALAIAIVLARATGTQLLAIGVSALLVTSARGGWVNRLLTVRPLLFLGAISYSLYLYHSSVGWRFVSLTQDILPGPWTPVTALVVYLTGVLGCVAFATILWWFIERPCLALCRRIRLPTKEERLGADPSGSAAAQPAKS